MRTAAFAAAMAVLFVPADWAQRQQHNGGQQRPAPAPHYSQPHNTGQQSRQAPRQQAAPQYRPAPPQQYTPQYRSAPQQQPPNANRQQFTGNNVVSRQPYGGPHLQDWLNRNQNMPIQDKERQLRNDPSFNRLPQADQQRLTNQLRSVDRMPEQQKDRRLARNEMLERLSPEERLSINRSGREWSALPADRQTQMRRAFQDLRGVPLDQRQTVLNSSRYQNMFSPQERGILSDFLKVEPYEAPQR
jgi:hypothetical protein